MNSHVYSPSEKLREYVVCYIIIDNDFSENAPKIAMDVYPNGLSGICFTFGDAYRYENDEAVESCFGNGAVAIGLHNCIFRLHPTQVQKHFVITFRQGVLPKLLKTPMHVLNNQIVDLNCFLKINDSITEQLTRTKDPVQQIKIVELWLTGLIEDIDFYESITGCFVADIVNCAGTAKIEDLCKSYNINKKYIERNFKEHIGMTPKKYSELIRLNTVINILLSSDEHQWNDIHFEAGFNDYSHLGKHTVKFTKRSPQMLKQHLRHSYTNGRVTNNVLGALRSLCIYNEIPE